MALILAILSTLSLIPTGMTLTASVIDRHRRQLAGINGELAALARQSVNRELLRVLKHGLLIAAIWLSYFDNRQPWINPTVCWLLAVTSIYELVFRHRLESRITRRRMLRVQT